MHRPARLPAPAAVDEITRALLAADIDQVLAGLPDAPAAAAFRPSDSRIPG